MITDRIARKPGYYPGPDIEARNRYETVRATMHTDTMHTRSKKAHGVTAKDSGMKTVFRRRWSSKKPCRLVTSLSFYFSPFLSLSARITTYVHMLSHEHLASNTLFSSAVWKSRLKRNLNDTCLEWLLLGVSLYVPKIMRAPGGRRRRIVVFASGTPLVNSLTPAWQCQRKNSIFTAAEFLRRVANVPVRFVVFPANVNRRVTETLGRR